MIYGKAVSTVSSKFVENEPGLSNEHKNLQQPWENLSEFQRMIKS